MSTVLRTDKTYVPQYTCLFVSCETNGRERRNHGNRSLLHAVVT